MNWEEIFEYDETSPTGLVWIGDPLGKIKTRTPAGSKHYRKNGDRKSIEVTRKGKVFQVHRIIWEMLIGPIPDKLVIDHKDGDPFNNNISNLKVKTQKLNCQNRKMKNINTSGFTGVCWIKQPTCTYAKAEIRYNGRNYQKTFSVKTFGLLPAFQMACEWRLEQIRILNKIGEEYTERHGK